MRSPPILDRRIVIRDPLRRPVIPTDQFGREREPAEWGIRTWANRRDIAPRGETVADGVVLQHGRSVFTIRDVPGRKIAPDAEVIADGVTYRSIGPAVHVGGAGSGHASRYLEIHARRVA